LLIIQKYCSNKTTIFQEPWGWSSCWSRGHRCSVAGEREVSHMPAGTCSRITRDFTFISCSIWKHP
jgi:hypothetical protein